MEVKKKEDIISNPNHYKLDGLDIEVKDVIKSALGTVGFLGFYKGNIIKYMLRASKKNGLEDYKKAKQYLDWLIEELDEDVDIDGQLTFLEDVVDKNEPKDENEIGIKLLNGIPPTEDSEMNKDITLDEFNRELTPEEKRELNDLSRKMMHTALGLTEEEQERQKELIDKKYGTVEDIRAEKMKNRANFLKLQEKLSKKVTK